MGAIKKRERKERGDSAEEKRIEEGRGKRKEGRVRGGRKRGRR